MNRRESTGWPGVTSEKPHVARAAVSILIYMVGEIHDYLYE
jgi:hypothetical protein